MGPFQEGVCSNCRAADSIRLPLSLCRTTIAIPVLADFPSGIMKPARSGPEKPNLGLKRGAQ